MAFAAFFARFALCVSALFARTVVSETVASSPANSLLDVLQSGCNWECNVVGSEFGLEMKALISEYRLITLHLKYEQQVEKKCSNQTDANNSSIKLAELWTWFSGHGNPSHGGQNMSQPSSSNKDSGTWFRKSLEGQIEVGVLCSLQPTKDLNGTQPPFNDLITMELMEEVSNVTPELSYSDTVLCYKLSAKNGSFVCVDITTITGESIHVSWREHGFRILAYVFGIIAVCYYPALLCLFKPTEVKTDDGIKIVLRGTSPVGIRSWIANFLSSQQDSIKLKLGKSGVNFLFCIGVMLLEHKVIDVVLPPALLLGKINSLPSHFYILIACNFLLFIRILVRRTVFRAKLSFYAPCCICDFFGGRENIFHADVRGHDNCYDREEIIKMHLRIQPAIVLKCCKYWFDKCAAYFNVQWKKRALRCFPLRLLVVLLVVLLAPLMFTLYCILCLIFIIIALFHSCPLTTFYDMLVYQSTRAVVTGKAYPFVGFFQSLVIVGVSFVLVVEISCDLVSLIRGSLMRLPNILPVTCLIIVLAFCFWKCYISYPRKYNDLAIKLYEHYKAKTTKTQGRDNEAIQEKTQGDDNEAVQAKTQGGDNEVVQRIEDSTREIPKDLFVAACEKLMPRRDSIVILLVKLILILILVFFFFDVIMGTPGTNDTAKAIGTLLALLIPKFGETCCSTDPQVARLDNETLDKNVGSIVDKYIGSTRETETQNQTIKINNNDGDTSAENGGADQELNFSNDKTLLLSYGTFVPGEKSENTTTPRTITTKV